MIRLSLDLAGHTGVGVRYDTGHVRCLVWNLQRGKNGGAWSDVPMRRLWRRLWAMSNTHEIQHIMFEDAFSQGAARWRLDSLQCAVMLFGSETGIPWTRVRPTVWKKVCLGKGNLPKAEYHQAARRKWPQLGVHTDDHAAALWLLDYDERTQQCPL